jgi:hypothetical protein
MSTEFTEKITVISAASTVRVYTFNIISDVVWVTERREKEI